MHHYQYDRINGKPQTFLTIFIFISQVDISYKKPILNLDLYDTTDDDDIFINQVLVETGIADFLQNPAERTGESLVKEMLFVSHVPCCIC